MIDEMTLYDKVINTIRNNISKKVKMVDYLMEVLELSRESVYRRIRKEIPFTVAELAKLSLSLGFSIDEMLELNNNTHFFFDLQSTTPQKIPNIFTSLFHEYEKYLNILVNTEKSKTFLALNKLPPLFAIFNESLFKFNYYKTMVENSKKMDQVSFSELKIPRELQSLFEKISINLRQIHDVILIFSPDIFLTNIKSIQYFYHRKLLTTDELLLLREELMKLVNFGEMVAKYGCYNADSKVDIYLSSLPISSNTLFIEYGEVSETHFWIYDENPLIIKNIEICAMQKELFQSMKNHSMLISSSNEIIRENFFDEQRKLVENNLVADEIL
jgi:hypothetical protein